MAQPADASTGGLSPEPVGAQAGGKRRSAWISHVKKYAKDHRIKFGDALSKAGASFKKSGGGGVLAGKGVPMGGRRSRMTKKGRRGGALYGFGGGNGAGGADLADGSGAYGHSPDATYRGSTELTGAAPPASGPPAGGRRTRRRRRSSKVGGKRRR
jgi:hypothetical protein